MIEVLEFSKAEHFGSSDSTDRVFATLKVADSASVNLGDQFEIDGSPYRIVGVGMVPPQAYAKGILLVSAEPVPEPEPEE